MKKTNSILLVLLFMMIVQVQAQSKLDARKVLDKIASVVGHKGGATGSFIMSSNKFGNINGTLSIKGNKFMAKTSKMLIWYDGKTQWSYVVANNEVNISTPNESKQAVMNPYTFINMYKQGYTYTIKEIGKSYQIHLVAQNTSKSISEIYITANKISYIPTQLRLKRSGEWTTISISNFQKKNLDNSTFIFNAKDFPKVEIIDLR